MKKDKLKELFGRLEGEFDVENPRFLHQQRFLNKLKNQQKPVPKKWKTNRFFKPWMGVAASIAILLTVVFSFQFGNDEKGLAGISTEMAKTQAFYTASIAHELREIKKQQTPENKLLIEDALKQLQKLETEYVKLQKDLTASGGDDRVIFAMISNFQNRINILKNVLEKIQELEQLKQKNHELPTTI